jgi:hypothetical protein
MKATDDRPLFVSILLVLMGRVLPVQSPKNFVKDYSVN